MQQSFDDGLGAGLGQRTHHTGEGGKGLGAPCVLGTLRDLAGDHGWPQGPLGSVVGGLDAGGVQKAQEIAPVVMPPQLVEQPLAVRVLQPTVPQMMSNYVSETLGLGGQPPPVASRVGKPTLQALTQPTHVSAA